MTYTIKSAQAIGRVSQGNTKMPGTTFAIDAFACITGSKLAQIEGTPCHACYARKLQKLRPSVDKGWKANLSKWKENAGEVWQQAVAWQILKWSDGYHRWFDSGDLQSLEMLEDIVAVCRMTPNVKHWLPTQERAILRAYHQKHGDLPDNLVVRVSASKVDHVLSGYANTSNVYSKDGQPMGHGCPARQQGNACGDCRACWSKDVANVSYPKH